jgi:hypothetical protein
MDGWTRGFMSRQSNNFPCDLKTPNEHDVCQDMSFVLHFLLKLLFELTNNCICIIQCDIWIYVYIVE